MYVNLLDPKIRMIINKISYHYQKMGMKMWIGVVKLASNVLSSGKLDLSKEIITKVTYQ